MTPVERARACLGVPWQHHGRDPALGLDCIGLIVVSFPFLVDRTDYARDPHDGLLEANLAAQFGPPVVGLPQVGDVVAIAYPAVVRHVGVIGDYPGGLSLIHTSGQTHFVTEHRLDAKWLRRVRGIYRLGESP